MTARVEQKESWMSQTSHTHLEHSKETAHCPSNTTNPTTNWLMWSVNTRTHGPRQAWSDPLYFSSRIYHHFSFMYVHADFFTWRENAFPDSSVSRGHIQVWIICRASSYPVNKDRWFRAGEERERLMVWQQFSRVIITMDKPMDIPASYRRLAK